jgi:hypothetical protein
VISLLILGGCAKPRSTSATPREADKRVVAASPLRLSEPDTGNADSMRERLGHYQLVPLAEAGAPDSAEHYRFLWERWLHPSVLIDVEFKVDGTGTYKAMVWNEGHGNDPWVTEKTRYLTSKDRDDFRLMIDNFGLMGAPQSEGAPGFEGSSWSIELVSRNRHNEIYRWSPEFGHVRTFGVFLINKGIDSPLVPIF